MKPELLVFACCCFLGACAAVAQEEPIHPPAHIRADIEQFVRVIAWTHPKLAYSTDLQELEATAKRIADGVEQPLTTRAAWRLMATLNPVFHDAHVGLQYPVREFHAYQEGGGAVFPMAVYVDDAGVLRVAKGADAGWGIAPDEEIVSINDIPVDEFLRDIMPRMRGESVTVQRLVLTYNFAAYFWTIYGPQPSYTVRVRSLGGTIRKVQLPEISESARPQAPSAAYHYETLRRRVGYMDLQSFDISLADDFRAFLQASFGRIKSDDVRKLIIDLRRNPGGAHELSDALLEYLTAKRVRQASRLIVRVSDSNRDIAPSAAVGDVLEIPFDDWIEPAMNPLRFTGEVFLLIGPRTYSQAIVFAAIFQDFDLGTVVGQPTDGWANQTGQVQMTPLRHTGLLAAAPPYIIIRPSGDRSAGGLQPDLWIADDPANPRGMIDQLLSRW